MFFRRTLLGLLFILAALVQSGAAWAVCGVGTGDCYWVGGTANWDGTGTPFASTSGGIGVGNPTSGANVFFDSASGANTVTIASGASLTSGTWNFSGFTGTFAGSQSVTLNTGLVLGSGMTLTFTGSIDFDTTGGNITSNGKTLSSVVTVKTATFNLLDDLTSNTTFTVTTGTLVANNHNITASTFNITSTGTVTGGSGNITVTGTGTVLSYTAGTWTGTGTLTCNNSSATGRTISANGKTIPTNVAVSAGTGNLTITSTPTITGNLDFTGFAGTWQNSAVNLGGNLVVSSGMTLTPGGGPITFTATSGTKTITSNSVVVDRSIIFNGVGGTWQLADNLTTEGTGLRTTTLTNGSLNLNNKNLTTGKFSSSNSNVRVLTLGSGTVQLNSSGTAWDLATPTNMTLTPNTSTIKLAASSSSSSTFSGGGLTYNNFWAGTTLTGAVIIVGSNTFNDFKVTSATARTVTFTNGTTQTVSSWTVVGTAGNLITIQSDSAGVAFNLSKASGSVASDYLSVKDSAAAGGATWCAGANSTNVSGNSGWVFSACSTTAAPPAKFMLFGVGGYLDERYRPANDNHVSLKNAA